MTAGRSKTRLVIVAGRRRRRRLLSMQVSIVAPARSIVGDVSVPTPI